MTSATEVNIVSVLSGVRSVAGSVIIASGGFITKIDPATVLIVIGAVIFGIATWRRDTRNVLRQQNTDLSTRLTTLEGDLERERQSSAEAKQVAKELAARPTVDGLADVITKLVEQLHEHDRQSREEGMKVLEALADVAANQHANTTAVQTWATGQAKLV